MKRAMPLILMLLLLVAGIAAAGMVITNPTDVVRPTNADHFALETPAPLLPAANQPLEAPEPAPQVETPADSPAETELEDDITPASKPPNAKPAAAPGTSRDEAEMMEADVADLRQDLERVRQLLEEEIVNQVGNRPVRFSGTVVDHMGIGVEGANISIDFTKPTAQEQTRRRVRAQTRRSLGKTGADGVYSVVFYMPEALGDSYEVMLLAGAVGQRLAPHHTLTISPDGEYAGINFAFPPSAGVSGRVVDAEYNAVAGARVTLAWGEGKVSGRIAPHMAATTDSEGNFTITGLEGGSYMVIATASGYSHVVNPPTIELSEGAVTTMPVDVVLARSMAIKFKAVCAERTPTGSFAVTCTDARGMQSQATGRSDKDGNAMITKVPAGTVRITIRWPNYKIGGQDTSDVIYVSMAEGQHTDLGEITLEWAPRKRTTGVTKDATDGK